MDKEQFDARLIIKEPHLVDRDSICFKHAVF